MQGDSDRDGFGRRPVARKRPLKLGRALAEFSDPGRGLRIQRVLAAAGVASRRACEAMIAEGRVTVNGRTLTGLPAFVDPTQDRILVDGRPVAKSRRLKAAPPSAEQSLGAGAGEGPGPGAGGKSTGVRAAPTEFLYLALHKPERVMSTLHDDGGRKALVDVMDHPAVREAGQVGPGGVGGGQRVYPVGRLDFHLSGLLLLTNDGELAHRLTHARFGVAKIYRAKVAGRIDPEQIAGLEEFLLKRLRRALPAQTRRRYDDVEAAKPLSLAHAGVTDHTTTLDLTTAVSAPGGIGELLHEAGLVVKKLLRVGVGPILLKGLGVGRWRDLDKLEVRELKAAVGLAPTASAVSESRRPKRNANRKAPSAEDDPTLLVVERTPSERE